MEILLGWVVIGLYNKFIGNGQLKATDTPVEKIDDEEERE